MLTIILCTGLPGSGKSVYCDVNYTGKVCTNFALEHLDMYLNEGRKYNFYPDEKGYSEYNNFNYTLSHMRYKDNNTIVIDGLYLTFEERKKLLLHIIDTYACDTPRVKQNLPNGRYKHVFAPKNITIQEIYWKENREACLSNDMLRNRHVLAQQTILNSTYDSYIPKDFFKDITNNNITINDPIFMDVEKYSNEKGIWECEKIYNGFKDYNKNDPDMIVSDWKDTEDPDISHEFDEFDAFIENICPDITFLQYKRIKKACNIKIEPYTSYDYYGSHTTYNRYKVNINDIKKAFINCNIPCKL